MKNDRESWKFLNDVLQNVETQWRWNKDTFLVTCTLISSEFVSTVRSSDSDCKGITSGSVYELFYFFWSGVALMTSLNYYFILDTSQSSKLSLNYCTVSMSILNYLFGQSDVVLKRFGGSIDHNGGKSTIDTGFAKFEAIAVIQMQSDRNIRILSNCCFY